MARCAKCNQEVTTGYVLCDRCYKKMDGIREDSIKEILGDNYDLDRLKELVQADREGRCEVIPREEFFLRLNSNIYVIDDGEVLEVLLYIIGRDQNGIGFIDVVYLPGYENEKRLRFRFSDVGKTVFLAREEAEAALVVHAKWERLNNTQKHYCPECGMDFDLYACIRKLFNYCPYCGAKMDLKEDK